MGTVVRLGSSVAPSMQGKRVGVQWLYSCCHECPTCRRGSSHICPRQGNTGRSCPGTLQQYVVADSRHIFEIPEALSGELAAPLLCAGLTMMGAARDLRAHGLAQGDWVVILGSGGGLGHIGIQIAARVMGLRVIAVDKGSSKRSVSLESGAEVFVDYTESDVAAEVTKHTGEGAAGVMVVSDAEEAFRLSARLARPAGIILCIGLPPDQQEIPVSVGMCIRKGMTRFHSLGRTPLKHSLPALTIKGVLVGSENDMHELFQHAVEGVINPLTEVVGFSEAPESLRKLVKKEIAGRIVVALP